MTTFHLCKKCFFLFSKFNKQVFQLKDTVNHPQWAYDKHTSKTTEAEVDAKVETRIAPATQEIKKLTVEKKATEELLEATQKALNISEATNVTLNQLLADSQARKRDLNAELKA